MYTYIYIYIYIYIYSAASERYTPHTIELDTSLKPFIPELIPSIGEVSGGSGGRNLLLPSG